MGKMPRVTGKEMLQFLKKQGFELRRVSGSHHILVKGSLHVPVPIHGNKSLRIGTLRSILRLANIKPEEFEVMWRS